MTLQLVHKEMAGRRASSLYCLWIHTPEKSGMRLRAIWIDLEMREFERQCEAESHGNEVPESTVDEPGGIRPAGFGLVYRFVGEMPN